MAWNTVIRYEADAKSLAESRGAVAVAVGGAGGGGGAAAIAVATTTAAATTSAAARAGPQSLRAALV
jgi:hypothetical protein